MQMDGFSNACDWLSRTVDAAQYERLRWARNEAPMLAHLVELAQGAFADRDEFELVDEGSGHAFRRFVVKVHGNRVFAIRIALDKGVVRISSENIERSRYRVLPGDPDSAEFDQIDADWMAAALANHFQRIENRQAPPAPEARPEAGSEAAPQTAAASTTMSTYQGSRMARTQGTQAPST